MNLANKTHVQRYDAALVFCKKMQEMATKKGATIFRHGYPVHYNPFYQVNEHGDILIQVDEHSFDCIFMADSDYDEGCYDTIKEWKEQFLENTQLWKRVL